MIPLQASRTPFVDRRQELAVLADFLAHPPKGPDRHRAIVAPRRIGKSELIREFRRRHPKAFLPYVEVEAADITASGFVRQLVLAYLIALYRPRVIPLPTTPGLLGLARALPDALHTKVSELLDTADRDGLPEHELREQALFFGEQLLMGLRKRGILFLDECQKWFAGPGEAPTDMERVLAEFVNLSDRLRLVVTGSATRVMEATFRETVGAGPRRPLYGRFALIEPREFADRDAKELVEKFWRGLHFGAEAVSRVYTLTRGHPAAVATVSEHVATRARLARSEITPQLVERAFAESLFESHGLLNAMVDADYRTAIAGRAPATMERLLLAVAELGPSKATGTEIARSARVKQPNVGELLRPLLLQDLLRFDEERKTYRFWNPHLPIWLRGRDVWLQSGAVGQPYVPTLKIVEEELARFREEVAKSLEARARDSASKFDGRELPGRLFGTHRPVSVPEPSGPIRPLRAVDRAGIVFPTGTSVEVDIYVPGPVVWLGEAKSGRRVTAAMIEQLRKKAEFFRKSERIDAEGLWFVSSAGYDEKAKTVAARLGIYLSRASDLKEIDRLLAKR